MRYTRRLAIIPAAAAGLLLAAGPAMAHQCINPDKPASAGVQIVIDTNTGEPVWVSTGLQKRIDQGLVNPETGEGFSGLVGLDFNGDGAIDLQTFIVTPDDEIPCIAQVSGAPDHGIINAFGLTECEA